MNDFKGKGINRLSATRMPSWHWFAWIVALLVAGAACSGGGSEGEGVPEDYLYPVQEIERIEDRSHFPVGNVYDAYNSNPPTSGPHAASPANFGISDLAVPREMAVHNMEHAGVVVWYDCNAGSAPLTTDECAQLRNDLSSVVQPAVASDNRVLMTPYPGMTNRIALTAWGTLDEFDDFDANRVQLFIDTFECSFDPENFC